MASTKLDLANLKRASGARRRPKRIGRGPGSGHGKTATRGNKGQNSRSGRKHYAGFEGGQMPLHRRLPKRGFTNLFRRRYAIINVGDLARFEGEISPEKLLATGVIHKLEDGLKILGGGQIEKALTVRAHRFSRSAQDKITRAGGKVEVIVAAPPAEKPKDA